MDSETLRDIENLYNFRMLQEPIKLSGGSIHDVYRLFSENGCFVVKILNPRLYKDPDYVRRLDDADHLEKILKQNKIPVVGAKGIDGRVRQEIHDTAIYLFDFFDGNILDKRDISNMHCTKIGKVLADIHRIQNDYIDDVNIEFININWDYLRSCFVNEDKEIHNILSANIDIIMESQENGNIARNRMGVR